MTILSMIFMLLIQPPTIPEESEENPFEKQLAELRKLAEKRPEAPKSDPKNTLKPLTAQKNLFLEVAADPKNPGKVKPVRVLFHAEVCLTKGPLEVLLCRANTKEHEAILRTEVDARFIHAALVAAGGKPGTPVQFIDPKTMEPDYKPATGSPIDVTIHYSIKGKTKTVKAQQWITNMKTKKPMDYGWVFAGSRLLKNPDQPNAPAYYTANSGEYISISNFLDSMLEVPFKITDSDEALMYQINEKAVPPILSEVWVILQVK